MFKSVILRPFEVDSQKPFDQVKAFESLMDPRGSFVQQWDRYFDQQRKMANRFEELQKATGKMFTWGDVDMSATYLSDPDRTGRERPSPAEFVARWVVEVATNMDLSAECRAGPRLTGRPQASDFEPDESRAPDAGAGHTAEPDGGPPAGPAGEAEGDLLSLIHI